MIRPFRFTFEHWTGTKAYRDINASNLRQALSIFNCEHRDRAPRILDIVEFTSPYWYSGVYDDGEEAIYYYDSPEALFYHVAKHYAFDDCADGLFTINTIVCDGVECYYGGWEPNMIFSFYEKKNHQHVYSTQHMEWDH